MLAILHLMLPRSGWRISVSSLQASTIFNSLSHRCFSSLEINLDGTILDPIAGLLDLGLQIGRDLALPIMERSQADAAVLKGTGANDDVLASSCQRIEDRLIVARLRRLKEFRLGTHLRGGFRPTIKSIY